MDLNFSNQFRKYKLPNKYKFLKLKNQSTYNLIEDKTYIVNFKKIKKI